MEKLGVHNRMELLKYAISRGITSDFPARGQVQIEGEDIDQTGV
jgi:hypothetical protein